MSKRVVKFIIKDMGRQGLEVFLPETPANPGRIECWGTLFTHEKGEHPGPWHAPMSWGEAAMGYFWGGRKPSVHDQRVPEIRRRLQRELGDDVQLKRVMRDTQAMRKERWKR